MRRGAAAALVVVVCAPLAGAQESDEGASSGRQPDFWRQSALSGDWRGVRPALEERGLTLLLSYAIEGFVAPALPDGQEWALLGVGALGIDVDLGVLAARGLGTIHILGFGIHGQSLTDDLGDIHGVSNNAAAEDVRLFEAWYEQPLGPAALRAGLLSADQEFVIAHHGTVLIDATFGMIGQFSTNVLGPVYPVGAPGMSARVTIDFVAVRAAVYDGGLENKHGIPTSMGEGLLGLGEIGFWEAVKVGGWTHSDRGEGVFALVDRDVHPLVGGFSRVGVSPDGPVRYYADAGVRLKLGPLRPADFVGIGAAFSRVAADPVAMTPSFDEAIVETTYHAAASGWMTLQPDMQLVFQPDRTVFVCGMRATVAF